MPDLYCLKEESWWGTHSTLIVNTEDQEHWFESIPDDQLIMVGEWLQPDDSLVKLDVFDTIGVAVYTGIDPYNRCLRISGSVFEDRREPEVIRAAFAAGLDFAFEILNVQRVEAEVLEYHIAAQNLEIDYLGMHIEGRRRSAVYKSGRYYDSILLGLLRHEWEASERVRSYGMSCNLNVDHSRLLRLCELSRNKRV